MKKFLLLALVAFLASCSLLGAPSGAQGPQTRADARAVVLALAAGVDAAAESCAAYVDASHDLSVKAKCLAVLEPASKATDALAVGVDAWTVADQGKLACGAASVLSALSDASAVLSGVGVKVPAAVEDALSFAKGLAPSCQASDGGSE